MFKKKNQRVDALANEPWASYGYLIKIYFCTIVYFSKFWLRNPRLYAEKNSAKSLEWMPNIENS
jgi:hypothetical protein